MEFDFTSSTLANLSTPQQIAKYRQLAEQAEKTGFLSIAKQWRTLAEETEQQSSSRTERLSSATAWEFGKNNKIANDAGRPAFGKRSSAPAASRDRGR